MVGGYPANQRRDSGSTAIELNSYPYTPNPRHTEHRPYPEDDRESIRTAVVPFSHSDEENLLYGKGSATSVDRSRHGGPRTPSPTPSELKELQSGAINWDAMKSWRYWIRREWFCESPDFHPRAHELTELRRVLCCDYHSSGYHDPGVSLSQADCPLVDSGGGMVTRVSVGVYDTRDAISPTPFLSTTGGWLVPIAVLFVISFPPLFGHEIIAILCGLVWGFWIGFGIVSAGTLAGEIGNF